MIINGRITATIINIDSLELGDAAGTLKDGGFIFGKVASKTDKTITLSLAPEYKENITIAHKQVRELILETENMGDYQLSLDQWSVAVAKGLITKRKFNIKAEIHAILV